MKFKNESKAREREDHYRGAYGFDKPSKYLFQWSNLLQTVVSQAGTYFFKNKFNSAQTGIFKCEGGCNIQGVGDLVLRTTGCHFDSYSASNKTLDAKSDKMSEMITKIVLEWNPNDPIDSMIKSAAEYIEMEPKALKKGIEENAKGGLFNGDALSSFFDWNPFGDAPLDEKYRRFAHVKISGEAPKVFDQGIKDEKLGKKLKDKINIKIREAAGGGYCSTAMCCAPKRLEDDKLKFWINTGTSTQIDGWKSEEDIKAFLKSDGILKK
jgi:hypothetical protein